MNSLTGKKKWGQFFFGLSCEICGKSFEGRFIRKRKTCSKECRYTILSRRMKLLNPSFREYTQKRREKISKRVSGSGNPFYGKTHSEKFRIWLREKSQLSIGEKSPRWIKDRTKLAKRQERMDSAYREWRKQVWIRDNFKCRMANQDCNGKIEAHHILTWRDYPELRYEIKNGITLCHFHHPHKRIQEKILSPFFQELVKVSNENNSKISR